MGLPWLMTEASKFGNRGSNLAEKAAFTFLTLFCCSVYLRCVAELVYFFISYVIQLLRVIVVKKMT